MTTTEKATVSSFGFELDGDVLTVNEAYNLHWGRRADHIRATREQARLVAAAQVKAFLAENDGPVPCLVEAAPWSNNLPRQDTAACNPTVKAAIDGLVDAGLWPDDTAEWVTYIGYWPEKQRTEKKTRGVEITVIRDSFGALL